MTTWIEVSPEAVEAAQLHVLAYRNAGLEPDPVVEAMAEAEDHTPEWIDAHAGAARSDLAKRLAEELDLHREVIERLVATFGGPGVPAAELARAIKHVEDIDDSTSKVVDAAAPLDSDLREEVASELAAFQKAVVQAATQLQAWQTRAEAEEAATDGTTVAEKPSQPGASVERYERPSSSWGIQRRMKAQQQERQQQTLAPAVELQLAESAAALRHSERTTLHMAELEQELRASMAGRLTNEEIDAITQAVEKHITEIAVKQMKRLLDS